MIKFAWKISPDAFVLELERRKRVWRRALAGAPGWLRKRRVGGLSRARVRRFKQHTGLTGLPSASALRTLASVPGRELDIDELKIVLVPAPNAKVSGIAGFSTFASTSDTKQATREESARKRLRRSLHEMTEREHTDPIELLASRRTGTRRAPVIGDAFVSGRRVSRGLFLEAIGAAIIPNLSDQQINALEEAGAIILDNSFISVDNPTKEMGAAAVPGDPWHLHDINVTKAREKKLTGKDVLIGVVDTGIDADHPEFEGKAIFYQAFKPSGEKKSGRPRDYGDHGTHVSGLCAGKSVGVAPDASLAVAAVLTHKLPDGRIGGTMSQVLAGMNWLALGGDGLPGPADVINASLGLPRGDLKFFQTVDGYRTVGALLVASVGNDGHLGFDSHTAPGSFEGVVAIGAADAHGHVAPFSAWGRTFSHPHGCATFKPDLLAPGVDVVSCIPKRKYGAKDGTSMAAPLACGASALLLQKDPTLRRNPAALADALLGHIRTAATQPNGTDPRRLGAGSLDLATI